MVTVHAGSAAYHEMSSTVNLLNPSNLTVIPSGDGPSGPPKVMNIATPAAAENKWVSARCSTEPAFKGEGPFSLPLQAERASDPPLLRSASEQDEIQGSFALKYRLRMTA